jgi:hypothetical protein
MKTILCILALLVLGASSADAYVRRTIGGGYVVRGAGAYSGRYYSRGYYGHPVARGAAVAAGAAAAAGTGWGWNQPYYGSGYYGNYGYGDGVYANRSYVTGRPTLIPRYYGGYGAYAADGSPGYYGGYGAYAADGYQGYYANRSYVTGRPTLFPRYYGGW